MIEEVIRIEIAKLELKPDDLLAVRIPVTTDDDYRQRFARALEDLGQETGIKVLLYSNDAELTIIRKSGGRRR